jgi:tRNA uridine 5-carboxymethylaminomethyl modification enzyme
LGHAWGLVDAERRDRVLASSERVHAEVARLHRERVGGETGVKLLRRPEAEYRSVVERVGPPASAITSDEARRVEILIRYESYIERSRKHLEARRQYERMSLRSLRYDGVPSLSNEGREMLERARPATVGAAQRLRGVRDSDVTALLVHLKRTDAVSRETSRAR